MRNKPGRLAGKKKGLCPLAALLMSAGLLAILQAGCTPAAPEAQPSPPPTATPVAITTPAPTQEPDPTPYPYINIDGDTIEARFNPPQGFTRTPADAYGAFLRQLPLLPHGSPILLYNGEKGAIQDWHCAVLDMDIGERDLQQCADAALRLRCEYLFSIGDYESINYHLTNGFPFPYSKWREGYRLGSDKSSMVKSAKPDESYDSFRKYLDVLFNYASTRSLAPESETIPLSEMRIGDVFLFAGKPGHCVIVVDICESGEGLRRALLAQSSMPAQSIHILRRPDREDPWFSISHITFPLRIMGWDFEETHVKRIP